MALQVWLPLNKQNDARNQGLSNAVASNLSYSAYGKLGGCYAANGTICNWGSGHTSNGVTVAFWHKWQGAVPTGWVTTLQFPYSDGDRRYYLATNNGHFYPAYREAGYETKFTLDDKWHHITMAVSDDGTSLSIYIDGILDGAIMGRSGFQLGGDLYMGQCYINDLRIYDHCLSPKEIKEISKGLVLHYPLNDAYAEGTTNIASNLSPSQIGGWQKMTITKLSTNNYHLKHQTSDSANLSYWSTFVYTLPSEYSNKTISFSARIKNIVYNDIKDSSWLYIGPGNNGQYPTHGSAMFYCYELKENQLISWTGVLSNSNRYVLIELWNDANSTSGSIEFDVVNIQIEEKDHVTPYTSNTRNETTVYDCSGYQNNGNVEEFKAAGNNLVTSLTAGGQTTVSGETVTTSGVNADTYFTINLSESIVVGQTYTLSCIGKNIPTDGYFGFPLGWQGNTSLIFNIKNGYNEITFTANDGSWGTNRLFMDDYDRATAYINKCEFTGFKLYKHSIVNSGLNIVFDSPRYKIGAKFNGQHSIWLSSPLGSGAKEELTVSFWHKPNSQGNYRTIVSNNYPHSGFWIGCNCEGYGLWYYGGSFYVRSQSPLPNDVWYHCALTYKNQTYQWYLNGVPVTTSIYGTFKAPTLSSSISIGGNTNGDMKGSSSDYRQYGALSDFRMYTTALSADDIKELYNTSCIINS